MHYADVGGQGEIRRQRQMQRVAQLRLVGQLELGGELADGRRIAFLAQPRRHRWQPPDEEHLPALAGVLRDLL